MAEERRVIPLYDLNEFEDVLKKKEFAHRELESNQKLVNALRNFIAELGG